jgi:hypothetical protein
VLLDVSSTIHDFGTIRKWVATFTPRQLHPRGISPWYPLNRKFEWLQSRSGCCEAQKNLSPFPRIEARPSSPQPISISSVRAKVGRAIAQAVSRRLPTAAARVQTRVWSCGIFCDGWKWRWGRFSPRTSVSHASLFPLLLHNHLHYHPRLVQYARSGRSANSLTNQII